MGIHKTGTTSIQFLSSDLQNDLKKDGYEMPWIVNKNFRMGDSEKIMHHFAPQVHFSSCFVPLDNIERQINPCVPELLLSGLEIAKSKKHLFVSAESFSGIDEDGLGALSTYLSNWKDIYIIIYYRRYYDWLISNYNQQIKGRSLAELPKWEFSICDKIRNEQKQGIDPGYVSELLRRVKNYFNESVLILKNFHDVCGGKTLEEIFYCEALPNAPNTCDSVKSMSNPIKNSAKELVFDDLTYGAKKAGLIDIETDEEMKVLSSAVKLFQEKSLGLTSRDFDMTCLSPALTEWLFETSANIEKSLFPDFFNMTTFKAAFYEKSFHKLCHIDINATLMKEEWKQFFRNQSKSPATDIN